MTTNTAELINALPPQWQCVPLKQYFRFGKGLPITKADLVDNGERVISYGQVHAKYNTGVHVDDKLIRYVSPDYLETNKSSLCSKGDFIFADTSEDIEGCGNAVYVDSDTHVFAGYHTIILRSEENNKFLAYLFLSDGWRSQIRQRVQGIKVFSISQKILSQCQIWLPPAIEQQAIADYLDDHCSKIDEIIAEATASIEEYKKLKQAVIFEAVTGLNGNCTVYDSGNAVIGKVPYGWRKVRVKDISSRITVGVVVTPAVYFDDDGTVPFLRGINVKEYLIHDSPMVYINEETNRVLSKTIVHVNDLVIVRDGAIGVTAVVPQKYDGANVVSMIIVTPTIECNSDYLCYVMNSQIGKVQFDLTKIGAALTHTSVKAVSNIEIPLPTKEEQIKIVDYLNQRKGQIDALISEKQSLISDLQAYKKSLIYEVVTGKRRVV